MKAFRFRLEQARRWREAQFSLQQARVAASAAKAGRARTEVEDAERAVNEGAAELLNSPGGDVLSVYAEFARRATREQRARQQQLAAARQTLSAELQALTQARRRLRLLEELKHTDQLRWQRECDREIGAFADEMFLTRDKLSRDKMKLDRRARSSGG